MFFQICSMRIMLHQCNFLLGNWIKKENADYFVSSSKSSWENARDSCSSLTARLLNMSDNADADFLKNNVTFGNRKFWFGLRKNGSNIHKVNQNQDDILTIGDICVTAKLNKSSLWQPKINPCSWLRPSLCLKSTGIARFS